MKLEEFMRNWAYERVYEKNFSERLTIEGTPVWWFYNRFFLRHTMPRQLNTFEYIKQRKKIKTLEKIRLLVYSEISKVYLLTKEKRKIKFLKKEPRKEKGKKVLFLTYTNHISDEKLYRIQRVVDKVRERGNIKDTVVFVDPLSGSKYKTLRNRVSIYQYCTEEIHDKAKQESKRLHREWKELAIEQKRKMLCWEGLELWDYLKHAFNFFFSEEFLYITTSYYYAFKYLLTSENVKVVVLTSQNSLFEKCLTAAAHQLQINVLRLQHGIGEAIVPPDQFDMRNNYFYKLVFSDFLKSEAVAMGWPKEKIIVTGPVVFDSIVKYICKKKRRETPTILIATSPAVQSSIISEKEYLRRIEIVLREIRKVKGVKVRLKLHPREVPKEQCIDNYRKILDNVGFTEGAIYGGDVVDMDFYELIKASDLLVSFGSTVAAEAMIIGRPTVTIDLFGNKFHTRWIDEKGLTVSIDWNGDISGAIAKALPENDEIKQRCEEYIKRKIGHIDGNASENVVKLIEKMSK